MCLFYTPTDIAVACIIFTNKLRVEGNQGDFLKDLKMNWVEIVAGKYSVSEVLILVDKISIFY